LTTLSAWKARLRRLAAAEPRAYLRFLLAERLARLVYPKYIFGEYGRSWLDDRAFLAQYDRVSPKDRHHADRKFLLRSLLELIENVPGDTAECGVYEGASSYFICRYANGTRTHHMFDSFEGLPAPQQADGRFWAAGDFASPEEKARRNLAEFPRLKFYKGWIPAIFADVPAGISFAFVHVDVDLYEPTKDVLEFFYPRLSSGAVVVCDDYGFGFCPGATQACDEFLADKPENIVHAPTGQGFFIKR
jgi:hypothetical protein